MPPYRCGAWHAPKRLPASSASSRETARVTSPRPRCSRMAASFRTASACSRMDKRFDIIIIVSGTLARQLAPSGKSILILERVDWLKREAQNWDADAVFVQNRYVSPDTWYDRHGRPFQPQVHYFVGGATKLFGAALFRLRREDFG